MHGIALQDFYFANESIHTITHVLRGSDFPQRRTSAIERGGGEAGVFCFWNRIYQPKTKKDILPALTAIPPDVPWRLSIQTLQTPPFSDLSRQKPFVPSIIPFRECFRRRHFLLLLPEFVLAIVLEKQVKGLLGP